MDKKKLLIFITIILEWYVINKVIKKRMGTAFRDSKNSKKPNPHRLLNLNLIK